MAEGSVIGATVPDSNNINVSVVSSVLCASPALSGFTTAFYALHFCCDVDEDGQPANELRGLISRPCRYAINSGR